jgi:dipeptidase D
VESAKNDIADKVKASGLLAGGKVHQGGGYPGWNPNMNSAILKFMKNTYKDLYGTEPAVKAIHAGLECGIIGETVPGMDMISFGPTIMHPHSPDEVLEIKTVEKFWNLLKETLARIAKS